MFLLTPFVFTLLLLLLLPSPHPITAGASGRPLALSDYNTYNSEQWSIYPLVQANSRPHGHSHGHVQGLRVQFQAHARYLPHWTAPGGEGLSPLVRAHLQRAPRSCTKKKQG
jgi:hypothetical protein